MGPYELWRNLMYCVGVFVTCNVGGAGLRLAASALRRRHAPPERTGPDEADAEAGSEWTGQGFPDIRRQVDAASGDS